MTTPLAAQRASNPAKAPGAFAAFGSALLRLLEAGSSGALLSENLNEAALALSATPIVLAVSNGSVLANEQGLAPAVARPWADAFARANLSSVSFSRGTSPRELLLFAALLVAPGNQEDFQRLWLECGAWRIHVSHAAGGVSAAGDGHAGGAPATASLDQLCAAVRGGQLASTPELLTALQGHGAAATSALLEELARTTQGVQRRHLFEALLQIRNGSQHLVAALDHPLWFVARNAAAILGELKVHAAASALAMQLRHADARVRTSAATALGQISTPEAAAALLDAVIDPDAATRAAAWHALAMTDDGPPAPMLDAALRRDEPADVKQALLTCAARFPALDVGGGLVRFCAREFTRRSSLALMTFGVELLAARRPQSAAAFVRRLSDAAGTLGMSVPTTRDAA